MIDFESHPQTTQPTKFRDAAVESRCDAVVLGLTYLFPALSFAGDSLFRPCPVFTPRSSNRACRFAAPGSLGNITISPTKSCASALLAG
jgi:hypothetical protein